MVSISETSQFSCFTHAALKDEVWLISLSEEVKTTTKLQTRIKLMGLFSLISYCHSLFHKLNDYQQLLMPRISKILAQDIMEYF